MIRSYSRTCLALITALTANSLSISACFAASNKQLASANDKGTQVSGDAVTTVGNGGRNYIS